MQVPLVERDHHRTDWVFYIKDMSFFLYSFLHAHNVGVFIYHDDARNKGVVYIVVGIRMH